MGQSITSANSKFTLVVPGAYSSGVLIQGYSIDDMFEAEPTELTEARIGADGLFAGGYVFNLTNMPVMLQANSSSVLVFQTWKKIQDAVRDIAVAEASIIMPALGLQATMSDGLIKSMPAFPPQKKMAENFRVELTWGSWNVEAIPT